MAGKVFPVVFDGHNDVLLRLGRPDGGGPDAFLRGEEGHLDLPRERGSRHVLPSGSLHLRAEARTHTREHSERAPPALDTAYALRRSMAATAMLQDRGSFEREFPDRPHGLNYRNAWTTK